MNKVSRSEILSLGDYEDTRDTFRAEVMAHKRLRRLRLGPEMSFVFETHDTVLMQIQEMLRVESITRETAIAHELKTYNQLVPGPNELSVTLFVEIPDKEAREAALIRLAGMEDLLVFTVGGAEFAIVAEERDGAEPGRTTAVHYLKVPLSEEACRQIVEEPDTCKVTMRCDHAAYPHEVVFPSTNVAALSVDLKGQ